MLHVMLLQFRRVVAAPHIQDMNGINITHIHLSHEKNVAILSIESWLFDTDPCFMVYEIIPT